MRTPLRYIYFYLIATAITLFVAFTRGGYYSVFGLTGIPLATLLGSVIFFTFTIVSLSKAREPLKPRGILLAILIGISILELPVLIWQFDSTHGAQPEFFSRYITIMVAYGCFKIHRPIGKALLFAAWVIYVVWLLLFGYSMWNNKMNFGWWTGRIEQPITEPMIFQTSINDTISTADYAGKYLVLDFWYTQCGVCWKSFPKVEALYGQYKSHPNVVLLGVHCVMEAEGETPVSGAEMLQQEGYTFPVVSTPIHGPVVKLAGVTVYPTVLILDPRGGIVFRGAINDAAKYIRETVPLHLE